MQNLLSFIPPPPVSAPMGGATPGGLMNNMVTPQNNKNGHVGRAASNKALQSLLLVVGGVILLFGLGFLSEKKWGFLTRSKLKLLGERGLSGLKEAAEDFKNELYQWEKLERSYLTPAAFETETFQANSTFVEEFITSFLEGSTDVKDKYLRDKVVKEYIRPYGEVADLSLLRACALAVEKMKFFLQKQGYEESKTIDRHNWAELFEIEKEPLKEFAKKYIAKNKGSELAKQVKFYVNHLDKLLAVRQRYIMMNGVALDWLKSQHPAVLKHHPDAKFLEIDEDEEEGEKKKSKKDNKKSEGK